MRSVVVGATRVVRARPGGVVHCNGVPAGERTARAAIERRIGRSHAIYCRQGVAVGIIPLVLLDGCARLAGAAIARAGRRQARRWLAVARALVVGCILALPHPSVVIVGLTMRDSIDGIIGPAAHGLIVGGIGPLVGYRVQGGREVGARDDLLRQVVIDSRGQQSAARAVVVVGVVVFDPRRRTAARLLVIGGLRALHDHFTGRIGHGGRAAGVGVGGIGVDGASQQDYGSGARHSRIAFICPRFLKPEREVSSHFSLPHGRPPARQKNYEWSSGQKLS